MIFQVYTFERDKWKTKLLDFEFIWIDDEVLVWPMLFWFRTQQQQNWIHHQNAKVLSGSKV